MTDEFHHQLAELYQEDDKLRAEHRDWKARCEVRAPTRPYK